MKPQLPLTPQPQPEEESKFLESTYNSYRELPLKENENFLTIDPIEFRVKCETLLIRSDEPDFDYTSYFLALDKEVQILETKLGNKLTTEEAQQILKNLAPLKLKLGICFQYGIGVEENSMTAIKLYKDAAATGAAINYRQKSKIHFLASMFLTLGPNKGLYTGSLANSEISSSVIFGKEVKLHTSLDKTQFSSCLKELMHLKEETLPADDKDLTAYLDFHLCNLLLCSGKKKEAARILKKYTDPDYNLFYALNPSVRPVIHMTIAKTIIVGQGAEAADQFMKSTSLRCTKNPESIIPEVFYLRYLLAKAVSSPNEETYLQAAINSGYPFAITESESKNTTQQNSTSARYEVESRDLKQLVDCFASGIIDPFVKMGYLCDAVKKYDLKPEEKYDLKLNWIIERFKDLLNPSKDPMAMLSGLLTLIESRRLPTTKKELLKNLLHNSYYQVLFEKNPLDHESAYKIAEYTEKFTDCRHAIFNCYYVAALSLFSASNRSIEGLSLKLNRYKVTVSLPFFTRSFGFSDSLEEAATLTVIVINYLLPKALTEPMDPSDEKYLELFLGENKMDVISMGSTDADYEKFSFMRQILFNKIKIDYFDNREILNKILTSDEPVFRFIRNVFSTARDIGVVAITKSMIFDSEEMKAIKTKFDQIVQQDAEKEQQIIKDSTPDTM